jgi:hypothetical protein
VEIRLVFGEPFNEPAVQPDEAVTDGDVGEGEAKSKASVFRYGHRVKPSFKQRGNRADWPVADTIMASKSGPPMPQAAGSGNIDPDGRMALDIGRLRSASIFPRDAPACAFAIGLRVESFRPLVGVFKR